MTMQTDWPVPAPRRPRMVARSRVFARSVLRWLVVPCLVLPLTLHAASGSSAPAAKLYRYKNEQGRIEISHAVPADRVAAGYEVLDARTGRVIESVARELTPAELAAKQERDRIELACRQNIERVRTLYGSARDIDVAQEQAERSIDTRIGNMETNLALERRRLEEQERFAAERERSGRPVTEDQLESMARSRSQIRAMETEIAQRQAEREATRARFAEDRRLFERNACGNALAES